MDNVMGIINNNPQGISLKEITGHRSLASVPIFSRYRLIDFPLSNMVNSGITNVAIMLESRFRSLLDHIGPGKPWGLDTKRDGLFLLPPAHIYDKSQLYKGDVENFYTNKDYLHRSRQEYVIVDYPFVVCNLDYREIFDFHRSSDADITVVYKDLETLHRDSHYTTLTLDADDRVIDMKIDPDTRRNTKISLKKYVMSKDLLIELIDESVSIGQWDFEKNGIASRLSQYDVRAYPVHNYVAIIGSLSEFYRRNMEILQPDIFAELLEKEGPIYTKPKDEAATQYTPESKIKNVLAANGCYVAGEVENSILFRGVKIAEGAKVKNSIVMQKSQIKEDVVLENVITDKNVRVSPGKELKGDSSFPLIVEKGSQI
ncbi:glucose-1-phosphate adenylyltransferase subunit GlgD [Halarsenatibacter silvermanii]|uniref:Glucose-1-phosphate adenylyltransferase n=1 Tax=Halarsenatibacter silvermanii TaxID=321763 RepID=A0A1G9H2Q1_9FIRM|nr:glucose-1-phosphate adenylyltransferase subunit GlgD [Halarsenatibacter silvermanii]SDL07105.1 glucose-1-phosphate adenylyltransferase [Halarsenatibacter silvermanii]